MRVAVVRRQESRLRPIYPPGREQLPEQALIHPQQRTRRDAHFAKGLDPSLPPINQLTGFAEGTIRGHDFEVWEEDGSGEFARIYERVQREGAFWE